MHKRALIPAMAAALLAMPAWAQTPPAPAAPASPPAAAMPPAPPPPPPGPPHGPRPGAEMDGPGEPEGGPMMRMGPHHPFGPPPPPPSHLAGLAPAIHLRYGDLMLDVQCSIRDDADACADATMKLINQLRGTDSGDGGDDSGSSE